MVFGSTEERVAGALGTNSHRNDGIFGSRAVIADARGLLGTDHDAHCAAVNARGFMEGLKAAFRRHRARRFIWGLLATYVEPGVIGFGAAIFVLGLICAAFHFDQSAYRFAGITLTIVMLVTRGQSPGIIAAHRFVEVSLGIVVALTLTYLWPGHDLKSRNNRR